uniref:L-2-hydroxyglutarate dehydrogenase, mitochondrial n=1 Tax=Amphora coffeiformis TaxID=265554 RepID=A0A7S3P388_9STRA|mmetsp:Transcript_13107/g.26628  ORF Transcript_13107/g.26628 Transcript_13107/m.26628 type:complete len:397 (+) Transcript_13107:137-1327(+)
MASRAAAVAVEKVGPIVIGAGVVGLAVARALSVAGLADVLVLERNAHFGSETSARNSEVVHGGLYYPQDSCKARFCVKGRERMYQYCDDRQVEYVKMGKLVVATEPEHLDTTLRKLHEQALVNGYTSTRLLSIDEVQNMEPSVKCYGALWSPETGIVDSHGLMTSLLAEAEEYGATLAVQSTVEDANINADGDIELCVDGTWIASNCVINCAGLWSDRVARLIHESTPAAGAWSPPRQYFCRGNYFRLVGVASPFSHLIYPVPDRRGGLGVHATLDRSHQVKFGPDVEWLDSDADPNHMEYVPNVDRAVSFYDSIRKYWPDLPADALQPDYVGVRPKMLHPSQTDHMPFQDFVIAGPKQHGVAGLVHLFGIESPGLTSSLAIADYVADIVAASSRS